MNYSMPKQGLIEPLNARFEQVRAFRSASTKEPTRRMADRPFEFDQIRVNPEGHSILVPRVSSERRPYLPVEHVGPEVISSDLNNVLYKAPEWCIALIASRIHLVWIATVCGKLKSDFRYSNTLGWNTFPCAEIYSNATRRSLRLRTSHFEMSLFASPQKQSLSFTILTRCRTIFVPCTRKTTICWRRCISDAPSATTRNA